MVKRCSAGAVNGPALTASLAASGARARPVTARPGCSGIGSGVSWARLAGRRLAGSIRSRKNRVAGGVLSGSRASSCAARTNVRLSAAAVTPVNEPQGRGTVIVASAAPVAVTRTTALPVTDQLKSDIELRGERCGGLPLSWPGPFPGHVHDVLQRAPYHRDATGWSGTPKLPPSITCAARVRP
jgi:hypothetical protein